MFHARTAIRFHRAPGATVVARRHTVSKVLTPTDAPIALVARFAPVAPVARVARVAHTAPAALAIVAALVVGLLTFSVGTADGAPPGKNKAPNLTVAGTMVTPDGRTPVPRVRVTVMPESTVTFTDIDGDFLVSWNGRDGWVTVIPEERARDGSEWCKRVVLRGQPPEAQDPIVDLGLITVMPRAVVGYQQVPIPPATHPRPPSLRVPGPKPGEPDTCRVELSYATDIWGHVTRVEVAGGDQPPSGLKDAIFDWIRRVPWKVSAETPCGVSEPFKNREWMDYAWADTAWVRIPGLKNADRLKQPGNVPQGR